MHNCVYDVHEVLVQRKKGLEEVWNRGVVCIALHITVLANDFLCCSLFSCIFADKTLQRIPRQWLIRDSWCMVATMATNGLLTCTFSTLGTCISWQLWALGDLFVWAFFSLWKVRHIACSAGTEMSAIASWTGLNSWVLSGKLWEFLQKMSSHVRNDSIENRGKFAGLGWFRWVRKKHSNN